MSDRFYLRGTTWLGLLNTVMGALFNRVLVRTMNCDTGQVVGYAWDVATNHPQAKE